MRHVFGDLYSHAPNQNILCGLIILWSGTPITKALPQWNGENRRYLDGDAFLVIFPISGVSAVLWVSSGIGKHVSGELYSYGPNENILCGLIILWSGTPITKALPQWNGENR